MRCCFHIQLLSLHVFYNLILIFTRTSVISAQLTFMPDFCDLIRVAFA